MLERISPEGEELRDVFNGSCGITKDGRLWRYPCREKRTPGWLQGTGSPKRYYSGRRESMLLATRLIAEAWQLPNPNGYKFLCFKDGDPRNLHLDNLYWSKSNGGGRRGRKIHCIETGEEFASIKEAALALGIAPSHISAQLAVKVPHAKGKRFKYVEAAWKNPLARN